MSALTVRAGLDVHVLDDGFVVYDTERNRIHHLNVAAAVVLELCDGTLDADAVAEQAGTWLEGLDRAAVLACIEQLRNESLITG